jgi:hypothetical protein
VSGPGKLDRIVAEARRAADARASTYREQALKLYPWICGRCAREFTRANVRELTVHHRDRIRTRPEQRKADSYFDVYSGRLGPSDPDRFRRENPCL